MKTITKIVFAALLLGSAASTVSASGTNKIATVIKASETQDRHLSGFYAVAVAGSYDVYITQGSSESVKVEAPSNIIDKIITEVDGGVLKIHNKNNMGWSSWSNSKMVIYITAKSLNSISMSGSGDVFFKNGIKADKLALRISGSGDFFGKVDVNSLECAISGSGDMKLSGRAQTSAIKIAGSGDFSGAGLATQNTSVAVSGSGDARVNASQSVNASVAGSGDVYYTGGAKNVATSSSGSGDIHKF